MLRLAEQTRIITNINIQTPCKTHGDCEVITDPIIKGTALKDSSQLAKLYMEITLRV
jgi:hypothetical protein